MKRYETPDIKMIKYDIDRTIMQNLDDFGGDNGDNPFDDILNPTTTSAGATTAGAIALKF